jgi:hypothetical protein
LSKKWLVGLIGAGIGVAIVAHAASGGSPMRVDSYTVEGPTTIVIQADGGSGTWLRLTDVEESSTEVRITVKRISVPLPRTAAAVPIYFVVELDDPLGDRVVTDGFGEVLRR